MILYKPSFIPMKFVVIGAGGTGGRLIPLLAQFVKTITWIPDPIIHIIDFDMVEEKNLVRQNFIKLDVGKPKALVLAERYGRAFNVNICPVVEKVESVNKKITLTNPLTASNTHLHSCFNTVIIMCVDSAEARRNILSHVVHGKNNLIIDAGNENDFGQVVVYTSGIATSPAARTAKISDLTLKNGLFPCDVETDVLPMPVQFYMEMEDKKTVSCAELDQTLAINAIMATTIMGIIQNFVYGKPLPYHRIDVSLGHGSIPQYITPKVILDRAIEANNNFSHFHTSNVVSLDGLVLKMKMAMAEFGRKERNTNVRKVIDTDDIINDIGQINESFLEMLEVPQPLAVSEGVGVAASPA